MKARILRWMAMAFCVCTLGASGAEAVQEAPLLEDEDVQAQVRSLGREANHERQLSRARELAARHRLSSMQVKTICAGLRDDAARLEFALAAYPRVVDPENFYEVYDTFKAFSQVLRLHDQVRPHQHRPGPPVAVVRPPVTDEEARSMVSALRKESFDNGRTQLARQILTSSERKFLSRHIKEMAECFDFEPPKLEFAKFAYDYTADRENYFKVNDVFSFSSSREALSRFIESKNQKR